jgi:hypothetical protein
MCRVYTNRLANGSRNVIGSGKGWRMMIMVKASPG